MKRGRPWSLGSLLLLMCASVACADELKLKDGTKIVGNIVGFEGDSFRVETSYGFALVKKNKVASIVISEAKAESPNGTKADAKDAAKTETKKSSAAPEPRAAEPAAKAPAPAEPPPAVAKAPREMPMQESLDGNIYTNSSYGFRLYKPPSWHLVEGARKILPAAVVVMGTEDETTLFIVGRETPPLRSAACARCTKITARKQTAAQASPACPRSRKNSAAWSKSTTGRSPRSPSCATRKCTRSSA
jgi:hypothetical protein